MSSIGEVLKLPNGVTLRNRIVKSAMSETLADQNNDPTPDLISVYKRWGAGGAAMLITGNIPVDRKHMENAGNFVLDAHTDEHSVMELTTAAKLHGAKIIAQLSHAGRQTPQNVNLNPTSISNVALNLDGYGQPLAASPHDLSVIIDQFATSARQAQRLGFDGVEIHAAHGYLLSSSLSSKINNRTDIWGGELENRVRLLRSVIRSVRAATNSEFILGVKLNSSDFQKGGFDLSESTQVAAMLQDDGVDFIEISGGNFEEPMAYQYQQQKASTKAREAYFLEYAASIKAVLSIPLMVTGGFRSIEVMNRAITDKETDLIGMGRPFIIDPDLGQKLLSGSTHVAPALERNFPQADKLPASAVLNWFCTQLARLGQTGTPDLSLSIQQGHEQHLKRVQLAANKLNTK